MASALLQLKVCGTLLPCSITSRRSVLPAAHLTPQTGGRIQSSSAFWEKRRDLSTWAVSRGTWRAMRKRRGGVDLIGVSTRVSPEDTSSVAVEDVVEDATEVVKNDASEEEHVEDVTEVVENGASEEEHVEDVTEVVENDASEEEQLSPEEEEDRQNIQDILRVVELLRTKRDMTFNEVKLTVMIEDPRDVERRRLLNIEDDRGCSREDMGNALLEVYEGRIPKDKITLRELTKEMLNWPNLEDEIYTGSVPVASPYAKVTDTGVDPRLAAERAKVDWDSASDIVPGQEKKDISDVLPPAVGFSFLYLISALPIIIGVSVVVILFLNSLQ